LSNGKKDVENKVIKFKPQSDFDKKRIKYAVILIVLALVGIALFVFADDINTDELTRLFTYFSSAKDDDGSISDISVSSDARNSYGQLNGNFVVADAGGVKLYSVNGQQIFNHSVLMNTPVVKTGNEIGIVYDIGGNTLLVFNKESVLKTVETDYPVIDASISGDWITLTTEENGYKALVTVFDKNLSACYMFYSADAYVTSAAAAPDGHSVTALSMKIVDSVFVSELLTYRLDSEQLHSSFTLKDQTALYFEYISDTEMCVVCEEAVYFISEDGTSSVYEYASSYLGGFDISTNGKVSLVLNKNSVGSKCSIVTVDKDGTLLGSVDSNSELLSVSYGGDYVGALTSGQLNIYDNNMSPRLAVSDIIGAKKVFMQEDGTAFIVFGDRVKLYIP